MLRRGVFNVTERCILGRRYGLDAILHFCLSIGCLCPIIWHLNTFVSSKQPSSEAISSEQVRGVTVVLKG
jgi:hypothetical protein